MAPPARFAAVIRRSMCSRPNLIPRSSGSNLKSTSAFSSRTSPSPVTHFRFASVVGTMLPLHSAIADARLKSNIAVDTSCWSWLSQDFAVPR